MTIIGARPQFIKAAPISRAVATTPDVQEEILHTGQHYDDNMSDVFFRELKIPKPRYNLEIHGGPHGQMTGRMMEAIESKLNYDRPDILLIYGDTNSTLAGALVGAKLNIPIAHVEAGLRSYNRRMPEEINRILSDQVSTLLFCPTQASIDNLKKEGIVANVHHSGDVMFDATLFARQISLERSNILQELSITAGCYCVCTIHRSENTESKDRLKSIISYVEKAAGDKEIIFPVHPRTRKTLEIHRIRPSRMTLIEPVGYIDLQRLLGSASLIFTDSGGLQKEAYFHRVPCITLREETEWVETIDAGWNRLWTNKNHTTPRTEIVDYGTGDAASNIVDKIRLYLVKHG